MSERYNRKAFIDCAAMRGITTLEKARAWCGEREWFNEDDFIELYRATAEKYPEGRGRRRSDETQLYGTVTYEYDGFDIVEHIREGYNDGL